MELIQGFMNQPQDQSADEAIPILCERLLHSTLLTDRRAAVLGLKSFSRQFRESVIANGLKALVATLQKDFLEGTIVRAVLETILILFIRGEGDEDLTRSWISHQSRKQNGKYPSPSLLVADLEADHFSLWIADELTQSDDTLHVLVSVLDSTSDQDFYTKLYALQILQAVLSTRPDRTKECILTSPVGVSTILNMVSDTHEAVRNEAILLLMGLVNDSYHIQKIVAFEGIFDKMFDVIDQEGGIEGSIVVQDCLSLVTNLLKYNPSNQSLFLETGCVPKLGRLLTQPLITSELGSIVWNGQRLSNLITTLEIVRLFVVEGQSPGTLEKNQGMLSEMLMLVLRLVFSNLTPNNVKAVALLTTADLIRDNRSLQEQFSQVDVPLLDPTVPNSLSKSQVIVPVTSALLNWCLLANSVHTFPLRACSAKCLHSLFQGNPDAKISFMENQVTCFQQNTTNIFEALLIYDSDIKLNPYKVWFAAVILLYLFEDCAESKAIARGVTTGNAEAGEEVLSAIPAISELLASSSFDRRVSLGYLMALIVWMYEDFDAVDDFLHDSSTVKSLLTSASLHRDVLVQGMTSMLLGIAYEFSRSESPIPRKELHSLISKTLGEDNYFQNILKFQESGCLTEVSESMLLEPAKDESGLPQLLLCNNFVSLVKENFPRLLRCLSHDPEAEPILRLSYEVYDELVEKYSLVSQEFKDMEEDLRDLRSTSAHRIEQLETAQTEATDKLQILQKEIDSLRESNGNYISSNENLSAALSQARSAMHELEEKHNQVLLDVEKARKDFASLQQENQRLESSLKDSQDGKALAENGINKMNRELFKLSKEKDNLESNLKTVESASSKKEKSFEKTRLQLEQKLKEHEAKVSSLTQHIQTLSKECKEQSAHQTKLENQTRELQDQAQKSQSLSDTYLARLKEAKEFIDDLNAQKKKHEEAEAKIKSDFDTSIGSIEKCIGDAQSDSSSAAKEKIELKDYSQLLKLKISQLIKKHISLQDERDELRKSNATIRDDFASLETAKRNIEHQLTEMSEARASLESQLSQVEESKSAHDSKIASLNEVIDNMKSERAILLKEHEERLRDLEKDHLQKLEHSEARIQEMEKTIVSLDSAVKQNQDARVKLEAQAVDWDKSEKGLRGSVKQLEQDKTQIEQALSDCQEERDSQKREYEVKLGDLTAAIQGDESKSKLLQEEINRLQHHSNEAFIERASVEQSLKEQIDTDAQRHINEMREATKLKDQLEQDKRSSDAALAEVQEELQKIQTSLSSKEAELAKHKNEAQRFSGSFEQEKEVFQSKINKLTAHIDILEKELDLKGKEIERERELLTGTSEAALQDYSSRISKLNEKMSIMEKDHYKRMLELENSNDQLSLEAHEHLSELEAFRGEVKSLRENLKAAKEELTKTKDGQQKLIDALKAKVKASSAEAEDLERNVHASEQKKVELETQVASLTNELATTASGLKNLQAQYDEDSVRTKGTISELSDVRAEKEALEKQLSELANTLKDAETRLAAAEDVNKDQLQQIASLHSDIDQLEKRYQNSESEMKSKLTASSDRQKETEDQKEMLSRELSDTKKSLETAVASLECDLKSEVKARCAAQEELSSAKSHIDDLETRQKDDASKIVELERSREDLVPRSDLDDLMLIMSELEEKNAKYKEMLKSAGQDVSSDEDSTDEDEG